MPFQQKIKTDVQVAFVSSHHSKRPSSAPNLKSHLSKKYLLSRIPKGDSFIAARKSVADAKNKKEILAIIAPALQAARSQHVPELPKHMRKWTVREIAGLKSEPESGGSESGTSRQPILSPRPLHYLKDRIQFQSPGLCDIFEDEKATDDVSKQRKNAEQLCIRSQMEDDGKTIHLLDEVVSEHFEHFNVVKKELALNFELLKIMESEARGLDSPRSLNQDSLSNGKFAALRLESNVDPSRNPQQRSQYQQICQLRDEVSQLVEDIRSEAEETRKAADSPDLLINDTARPAVHLVSLTGLFRRALKSAGGINLDLGWVFEKCWQGMGLVFEFMQCLDRISKNRRILVDERNALEAHKDASGHASAAVAKLQESFDMDIYKKLVDGLQNQLYAIKKENIALRGRVKASELLTRQRLISHLYNDDDNESPHENHEIISTQRGEAKFFSVHVPEPGLLAKSEVETRRGKQRSFFSLRSRTAPLESAPIDDQPAAEDHKLLSAQSVGLERLSLPSTTLSCIGLDLVLGRIPHVITHALNSYCAEQDPPAHFTPFQLHQLSLQILLDIAQDFSGPPVAAKPPQLPDVLPIFFQIRCGTKIKADEAMGRFCSSLQEIQQQDAASNDCRTFRLISYMGKFVGLSKSNLTSHALRVVLFGLSLWYGNETIQKIHFEAQRDLFETRNPRIMTKATHDSNEEQLVPKLIGFDRPDLVLPLEIAQEVIENTHQYFHFKCTAEIAKSHLESEIVLADGTSVTEQEMQLLLTIHHIHQGIQRRLKIRLLKFDDIIGLFRRADPRRCGRMSMLQFISCIRSLRCGITDDDIMSVVKLFDTSSKNFQEVDYKKFAKFFNPVTLFVTVHTMISALVAMWSYETALNEAEAMRKFVCNDFKQRIAEVSEFTSIIQSMRSGTDITARKAVVYFQECLDISGTGFVTRETFLIMARVHNLFNHDPG